MPCIRSTYQTKRKTYTLIFSCQPRWHATKSVYYPPTFSGAFITSQTLDLPSSQSANKLETLCKTVQVQSPLGRGLGRGLLVRSIIVLSTAQRPPDSFWSLMGTTL